MSPIDRTDLWRSYNDKQIERREVRPLLLEAAELAGPGDGRLALELGCGAGVEAVELARRGWRVTAIDGAAGTAARIDEVAAKDDFQLRAAIDVVERDLESSDAVLPSSHLIYSGYSLPYIHPTAFSRLWSRIVEAVLPGGHLAVQLFGDRDSYVGNPDWNFHSKAEALNLLRALDLVSFIEQDEEGMAVGGPKHWHVFHIIARGRRH